MLEKAAEIYEDNDKLKLVSAEEKPATAENDRKRSSLGQASRRGERAEETMVDHNRLRICKCVGGECYGGGCYGGGSGAYIGSGDSFGGESGVLGFLVGRGGVDDHFD